MYKFNFAVSLLGLIDVSVVGVSQETDLSSEDVFIKSIVTKAADSMKGSASHEKHRCRSIFCHWPPDKSQTPACLRGNAQDKLELCLESGDDDIKSIGVGPDKESKKDEKPVPRLMGTKENEKNIVNIAKEKYGLKCAYVWHAITGYWGGVEPGVKELQEYEASMKYLNVSMGAVENELVWKSDPMKEQGLAVANPRGVFKFYDDLHSRLAANGVDGVEVDVQCILETTGGELAGRVKLIGA
ncbi:hypothetical protein Cgig2_021233 [Carnegiea gigantea]|uniref:Uncharacterized protein n=1 Tax=Carnegiea gigantea TaxID=171969 RepID=A0A9Q1KTQ7_9CARY|nr:hypothetical protein Cgig2_021233 [Carnegiea gigantea]